MEISEIRERLNLLADHVSREFRRFESDTSCTISSVDMIRSMQIGVRQPVLVHVELEAKL